MRTNRSNGFAVILIALGALILLGKLSPLLGSVLGGLFGILFAVAMIALGYYGIRRGNAFFGWIVLFFGILSLISKLAWLIVPAIGIGIIIYGVSYLEGTMDIDMNNEFTYERMTDRIGGMESHERVS